MVSIVLTGTSCCGKSSLLNLLVRGDDIVVEEIARKLASSGQLNSFVTYEAQEKIFREQLKAEEVLKENNKRIFLDRSAIDSLGYCKFHLGYLTRDMTYFKPEGRYDFVFMLDKLPFVDDGIRKELEDEREAIHQMLLQAYQIRGYNPIMVPVMRLQERAEYVLNIIRNENK